MIKDIDTQPVFVVGTGRCGTRMIYKMLDGTPGVEAYHEYQIYHVQPMACRKVMGKPIQGDETVLERTHGAAIHYSPERVWVDCSNKLSWLIDDLLRLFPNARFVHLVRDGRRVALSYYHKLHDEIYDDRSVQILTDWVTGKDPIMPPPDKKYWWVLPSHYLYYGQFERICWHWLRCNLEIERAAERIPDEQYKRVHLEQLVADENILAELCEFMTIPYQPAYFQALQTPRGVIRPVNYGFQGDQEQKFWKICGELMNRYGYTGDLYEVDYGHV